MADIYVESHTKQAKWMAQTVPKPQRQILSTTRGPSTKDTEGSTSAMEDDGYISLDAGSF